MKSKLVHSQVEQEIEDIFDKHLAPFLIDTHADPNGCALSMIKYFSCKRWFFPDSSFTIPTQDEYTCMLFDNIVFNSNLFTSTSHYTKWMQARGESGKVTHLGFNPFYDDEIKELMQIVNTIAPRLYEIICNRDNLSLEEREIICDSKCKSSRGWRFWRW